MHVVVAYQNTQICCRLAQSSSSRPPNINDTHCVSSELCYVHHTNMTTYPSQHMEPDVSKPKAESLLIMTTYTHMTSSDQMQPHKPLHGGRIANIPLLIAEYQDRSEDIEHFPNEYMIHLQDDVHPMSIHVPQKCLVTLRPLVKKEQNGSDEHNCKGKRANRLGVNTCLCQENKW